MNGTQHMLFYVRDGGCGGTRVTRSCHPSVPQASMMDVALEVTASETNDEQHSRSQLRR